jgi:O-antigen ligase
MLTISSLLFLQIVKVKKRISVNLFETACLVFIAFTVFNNPITGAINISVVCYLIFFLTLVFGLKALLTVNNTTSYSLAITVTTGTILLTYLVLAIYHCWFLNDTLTAFFFPNKSIFGILLASQIAFIIPVYFFYKRQNKISKPINWFFIGLITSSLLLLICTQSRAGYAGLLLALAYIGYYYLTGLKARRTFLILMLFISALLIAVMFLFKSGSSGGRLLIYKISAGMLKDNWFWGIGLGQFKVQYNQYQAAYFAKHNIDNKESLLADNSFYAFNDLLQAIIENGLIAFLLLAAICFLLVLQIKKIKTTIENKYLFSASVASLICILTGAMFSYPLQIFPIAVQAILCLSIINSFQSDNKIQGKLSETGSKVAKGILIVLSILLLIHFSCFFNYRRESYQAFELKRSGFRQKAMEKYSNLSKSYIQEGNILYLYAQELYATNQLTLAREILKRAMKLYCTNEVYKLSASIENELQNYTQAEADYKKAIYMVPNRMVSRNELFEYYLERKDTANAIYWGNSIINMPVKVPSMKTKNIQRKVRKVLEELKNR